MIEGMAGIARHPAYWLYTLRERKGWAEEAGYYNSLDAQPVSRRSLA